MAWTLVLAMTGCSGGRPPASEPACPPPITTVADAPPAPARTSVPAIPFDMPRATRYDEMPLVFGVEIAADGSLTIDGRPGDDTKLVEAARNALTRSPDVRALIRADKNASWGRVVTIIDRMRTAGIDKLGFGIQPEAPQKP
jgi:biopolymer transport protein ExbD